MKRHNDTLPNLANFLLDEVWYRSRTDQSLLDLERECAVWIEARADDLDDRLADDSFYPSDAEFEALLKEFVADVDPAGERFLPHRPPLYGATV